MARTLLLSTPDRTWRDWLKDHRKGRDLICLDPTEPDQAPPGRLCLFRGEKIVAWHFYGSLDPQRSPQTMITALVQLMAQASEDVIVQSFAYRGTPLLRHVTMLMAQIFQPDEILLPKGAPLEQAGFPVGPQEVELEQAFPTMVQNAQRKAHWMKLFENCEEHELELARLSVEGARLGSGEKIAHEVLDRFFKGKGLYGEIAGGALFLIAEEDPSDSEMARALDYFHCSRAHIAHPAEYEGLLCSFARSSGEDFGYGAIISIDFAGGIVKAHSTAVAPTPVRILRIGGLRVDTAGRELGEVRPWQV
ncbi:MAG: hypothetical protein BGO01_03335 [Armatimonadetes bacterium 55-13]|nr:hypothetical protein [Armatimonadota bacterium]OJU62989.1 MAG: hypothetical protein BGO01_03335 [Armatimonadetes bacterium 55-13]